MRQLIGRRIDPSRLLWLLTRDTAETDAALLERVQRHLAAVHAISDILARACDLRRVGEATLEMLLEVLPADRAAIMLRRTDEATGGVELLASRTRDGGTAAFAVSRELVADVIDEGVSLVTDHAAVPAHLFTAAGEDDLIIQSLMCVPLRTTDAVLGALYVDSAATAAFADPDLELLAAIGNQAGVALHRIRLLGALQRLLLDTIRAIAATVDARDGYTHRHSERVSVLAGQLAAALDLDEEARQTVELAGLLHDVGKIAVRDAVLNKRAPLTDEEFAEMREHPDHGARILSNIQSPAIEAVIPGVRYHHERWDGSGYPAGLAGDDIPLVARLVAVADVFDALTSGRAYQPAKAPEAAMQVIVSDAGLLFDPVIVRAAAELFARGQWDAVVERSSDRVGAPRD